MLNIIQLMLNGALEISFTKFAQMQDSSCLRAGDELRSNMVAVGA